MVAEKVSAEEIIEHALKLSALDQLVIINKLASYLAENSFKLAEREDYKAPDDAVPTLNDLSPEAKEKTIPTVKNSPSIIYKEASSAKRSLNSVAGAWRKIDEGWEKPIEVVIKEMSNWTKDRLDYDNL